MRRSCAGSRSFKLRCKLGPAATQTLPNYRGLLQLQGRLSVGARDEPDGHLSSVRLLLDERASQLLLPPPSSTSRSP